jgi:competence protein ComEC
MSKSKIFLIINLIFIGAIFLIGFFPDAYQPKISDKDIAYYNGHILTFSGRVCEEADVDYKSRRLTVCVEGKISGNFLVTTDLYPTYDYGDFVTIKGELKSPPEIDGFDYGNYLARYDIYSVIYYPKIESAKGSSNFGQKIFRLLLDGKQFLAAKINSNLPEPEAGLANAILLGYRRTVFREDLNTFSRVGLSHMIAISGSHITIMSAMIINFLLALGLRRQRANKIIFGFLILYPLITGLSASAVRSAIMGGLAFLAVYHHRNSSLIRALVFSASVMLVSNPLLLRNDIGFQLSFAAILGIIYIYPFGEALRNKLMAKIKIKKRKLKKGTEKIIATLIDTVNLTLVSQIVILPIALVNFKQLSLIAPLANVLVLWTFPFLLAALIIALFLSSIMPFLGVLWFLPSYLLLKYIFVISNLLAKPSWAAVTINNFNWYLGAGYYGVLIMTIIYLRRRVLIDDLDI